MIILYKFIIENLYMILHNDIIQEFNYDDIMIMDDIMTLHSRSLKFAALKFQVRVYRATDIHDACFFFVKVVLG